MKYSAIIFTVVLIPMLVACSTHSVQQSEVTQTVDDEKIGEGPTINASYPAPDQYRYKAEKLLKLVRIMEGGACQNEQQGVVGMFLLYASPDDIERIEEERGSGIFAEYEQIIEQFSMLALDQAVKQLEFSDDPFALDEQDKQRRLAERLVSLFEQSIEDAIVEFETNTTLTIDLTPLTDSLYFYLDGCEFDHQH